MAIKKIGKIYRVDVHHNKIRVRRDVKTPEQARRKEKQLLAEIEAGKFDHKLEPKNKAPSTPLEIKSELGSSMKEILGITQSLYWKNAKSGYRLYGNAEVVIDYFCKVKGVEDFYPSDIHFTDIAGLITHLEGIGNSDATINRKLSSLSKLFSVATEVDKNFKAPKVPFRKEEEHRIRWVRDREEIAILKFLDYIGFDAFKDFYIVSVDTGFRRGETIRFLIDDYVNGKLHIWKTKNGKARAVDATDRVREIIERRAKLGYKKLFPDLTVHDLRFAWDKIRVHLELQDDEQFVLHALRHTCASRLVQRGVPLKVVQEWMGHKSITTTLKYAHLAPSNFTDAMQTLNQPLSVETHEISVAS